MPIQPRAIIAGTTRAEELRLTSDSRIVGRSTMRPAETRRALRTAIRMTSTAASAAAAAISSLRVRAGAIRCTVTVGAGAGGETWAGGTAPGSGTVTSPVLPTVATTPAASVRKIV